MDVFWVFGRKHIFYFLLFDVITALGPVSSEGWSSKSLLCSTWLILYTLVFPKLSQIKLFHLNFVSKFGRGPLHAKYLAPSSLLSQKQKEREKRRRSLKSTNKLKTTFSVNATKPCIYVDSILVRRPNNQTRRFLLSLGTRINVSLQSGEIVENNHLVKPM